MHTLSHYLRGDFNIFFISKLEVKGGNVLLKRTSTEKLVKIKESLVI